MQDLLRCSITKLALREVTEEELRQFNQRIRSSQLRHLDGTVVQKEVQFAYVTVDGQLVYPVEEGIVLMLPAFAISVGRNSISETSNFQLREEKKVVQDWYNQFGWQESEAGKCLDSLAFGDYRPVVVDYDHKGLMRIARYLPPGGKYMLDVASGAVPHDEYVHYSDNFQYRICMDLSFQALKQAKKKLGARGIYILGDITNLPLQDNMIDTVMSLHTIYHVPMDEQESAFRELYRVLKPGGTELVVYNWGKHSLMMRIADAPLNPFTFWIVRTLKRLVGIKPKAASAQPALPARPARTLYFHAHNYKWFDRMFRQFCEYDMVCWRTVHQAFLSWYVRERFFGRQLLDFLFWFEEKFPHLAARVGQFPMFIIKKPAAATTETASASTENSEELASINA